MECVCSLMWTEFILSLTDNEICVMNHYCNNTGAYWKLHTHQVLIKNLKKNFEKFTLFCTKSHLTQGNQSAI